MGLLTNSENNWKELLSLDQVESAFVVDFEARTAGPQALLGVSNPGGSFRQYVLDPDLWPAGEAKAEGTCETCWCLNASLRETIESLTITAERGDALIIGFSRHELDIVLENVPGVAEAWTNRYRDGKRTLIRWASSVHPDFQFQRTRGSGRYSLSQFMTLADYDVATAHAGGNTGQRLGHIRQQLAQRGSYDALTPTVKRKWTNLLMHNYHDVEGLRAVLLRACRELELLAATKHDERI